MFLFFLPLLVGVYAHKIKSYLLLSLTISGIMPIADSLISTSSTGYVPVVFVMATKRDTLRIWSDPD